MRKNSVVSDEPIISEENDFLKRASFSNHVAQLFNNYKDSDSIAIALCGKWGSGKTSILNMISKSLDNETIITIKFNPWQYEKLDSLYHEFLKELNRSLESREKKISEKITKVITAAISVTDPKRGKVIENHFATSFSELRKSVENALIESGKRILVMVDDLDRLDAAEIVNVFKIVKSSLNFRNSMYLLSYDRNVISKAIESLSHESGESYLNKIIQLEISIPVLTNKNLRDVFERLISDINPTVYIDYSLYSFAFDSIRDIKRVVNSFRFKSSFLGVLLDDIDLFSVTLLEMKWPNIFSDIFKSKKRLMSNVGNEAERTIEDILQDVRDGEIKSGLRKVIRKMFPVDNVRGLRTIGKIRDNDYFDIFFMEVVKQSEISGRIKLLEKTLFDDGSYVLDLNVTNLSDEVSTINAVLRNRSIEEKKIAYSKITKWVISESWIDVHYDKFKEIESFFSYGDRIFRLLNENKKEEDEKFFYDLRNGCSEDTALSYAYFLSMINTNRHRAIISKQFDLIFPLIFSRIEDKSNGELSKFETRVLKIIFEERGEPFVESLISTICQKRFDSILRIISRRTKTDYVDKFLVELKELQQLSQETEKEKIESTISYIENLLN